MSNNEHRIACNKAADGIALITKGRYAEARLYLDDASNMLMRLFHDPGNADVRHVKFFQVMLMILEGNVLQARHQKEFNHAEGMLEYWSAMKMAKVGENLWHRGQQGEALAYWRQAIAHFEKAIATVESTLGINHPELYFPLLDYGSVLKMFDEAAGDLVCRRGMQLSNTLSDQMAGGGYVIFSLDPYGTSAKLPSGIVA